MGRPAVSRDAPPRVWTIGVVCSRPKGGSRACGGRGRRRPRRVGKAWRGMAGREAVGRAAMSRRHTSVLAAVGPHAGRGRLVSVEVIASACVFERVEARSRDGAAVPFGRSRWPATGRKWGRARFEVPFGIVRKFTLYKCPRLADTGLMLFGRGDDQRTPAGTRRPLGRSPLPSRLGRRGPHARATSHRHSVRLFEIALRAGWIGAGVPSAPAERRAACPAGGVTPPAGYRA